MLLRLGDFHAKEFWELERRLKKLPFGEWLKAGASVTPVISAKKTRMYHTGKLSGILAEAMDKALGGVTLLEDGGHEVHLRLQGDYATVSLDTSGEHLHKRGYRTLAGPAPLRENVAAACLLFLGYDGAEALCDPCAGSGTFAVEAGLISRKIPPGINRDFAFSSFANFVREDWDKLKNEAREAMVEAFHSPILANDIDPAMAELIQSSATKAGLGGQIEVRTQNLAELWPPPKTGLLVANPPWGIRLEENRIYPAIKRLLEKKFAGWRFGVIEHRKRGFGQLNLKGEKNLDFVSGGLDLRLVTGRTKQP